MSPVFFDEFIKVSQYNAFKHIAVLLPTPKWRAAPRQKHPDKIISNICWRKFIDNTSSMTISPLKTRESSNDKNAIAFKIKFESAKT